MPTGAALGSFSADQQELSIETPAAAPWASNRPVVANRDAFGLMATPENDDDALPVPHVRIGPSSALAEADRAALLEGGGQGAGCCERGCGFGVWC